ncbi:hypothetical protein [Brevibacterium paucivorans]|uniref:hypothetical protein n=1 Tax=Brevibacterium paucivorans TaxID=170994 RepID=UPI00321B3718
MAWFYRELPQAEEAPSWGSFINLQIADEDIPLSMLEAGALPVPEPHARRADSAKNRLAGGNDRRCCADCFPDVLEGRRRLIIAGIFCRVPHLAHPFELLECSVLNELGGATPVFRWAPPTGRTRNPFVASTATSALRAVSTATVNAMAWSSEPASASAVRTCCFAISITVTA